MASPLAIVVGLCAHGVSICRSLSRAGHKVVGIEANQRLPGLHTNSADVVLVDDINGKGLIDSLVRLSPELSSGGRPVLFLTNDRMVAIVAHHYKVLRDHYRLSWGDAREALLPLLGKEAIEERCSATGLRYPKTCVVADIESITKVSQILSFPIIFKPNQPLSPYKTLVVQNNDQLQAVTSTIAGALPAIAQEFIPGDDSTIRFAALYLNHGDVVARFEGRKLSSRPMGHTTAAIAETNDDVHELAKRFFSGLRLSGPVSLELKQAPDSSLWVIEPTVGRTDFWVGLCSRDGVDLPQIEYIDQVFKQRGEHRKQLDRTLWINEEREPAVLARLAIEHPASLRGRRIVGVFF